MRKFLSYLRKQTEPAYFAQNRLLLSYKVPAVALEYCHELSRELNFELKVSGSRASKLGDFRAINGQKHCLITVNGDLPPQPFLVTYLHEAAHAAAYRKYGNRIKPHGAEWQQQFRQLAAPLLNATVFSPEVLLAFTDYLQKPAASSSAHPALARALHLQKSAALPLLQELPEGQRFRLRHRTFVKVGRKRTRALCRDEGNQKMYLIPESAPVELVAC